MKKNTIFKKQLLPCVSLLSGAAKVCESVFLPHSFLLSYTFITCKLQYLGAIYSFRFVCVYKTTKKQRIQIPKYPRHPTFWGGCQRKRPAAHQLQIIGNFLAVLGKVSRLFCLLSSVSFLLLVAWPPSARICQCQHDAKCPTAPIISFSPSFERFRKIGFCLEYVFCATDLVSGLKVIAKLIALGALN